MNLKMDQESSASLPFVQLLPQGPAASSQEPADSANSGDENSEYCDPDLYFLA